MQSMVIMVDELKTSLEYIEEEGDIIMNEEFMMVIFQGIMDKLLTFGKYWTHMFQNKSMPVVGECQSKCFPFARLRNDIFSKKYDKNKEKSSIIGEMKVTSAKLLLAKIGDEKRLRRIICQVLELDSVGIINLVLTM